MEKLKDSKNRFIASNNVGVEIAKIFFASMTYVLVRSEGGRVCCDINGLPRLVKP